MTFPIPTVFKNGPWVAGGGSGFQLNGLENVSINPNRRVTAVTSAGEISPSFIYFATAEPTISGSVSDFGTAISAGLTPTLALAGGSASVSTLAVYGTQVSNLGSVAGSSSHFTTTVSLGVMILRSIRASQGQKASAQVEVHAIWDGTNDPLLYATNASLPSDCVLGYQYTLGPVYVDGSQLVGVKDVSVDMGITETKVQSDGNLYPTLIYTSKWEPKIMLTMTNAAAESTFGLTGSALSTGETSVYFQACSNMGTRIANNVASHVKLTVPASEAYIHPDSARLNADSGDCTVVIEPILSYNSGYVQPLTFSGASAIS